MFLEKNNYDVRIPGSLRAVLNIQPNTVATLGLPIFSITSASRLSIMITSVRTFIEKKQQHTEFDDALIPLKTSIYN